MTKETFDVLRGGNKENRLETLRELNGFLHGYTDYLGEKSSWRVYGKDEVGTEVSFRIKSCEEEEFVAKKIAQLINQLGGDVLFEKIERKK